MVHTIKTDIFEGPLELLLDLIEKKKLSVNQVSLAAITNEYVAEVKTRAANVPDEIAQFLVVASTLMLIKSRSLLPILSLSEEEETSIQDLENRLAKLQRVRELMRHIAQRALSGERMYARAGLTDFPTIFYPPTHITKEWLGTIARSLVEALPRYGELRLPEKTIENIVSLEEKIQELMARVESVLMHSFRSLIASTKEKTEIIISFLALLELVKQGHIAVEQHNAFEDITITSRK